jgi:hypothetical protein
MSLFKLHLILNKMTKNNKYSFAFTTMAAQIPETVLVVNLYFNLNDWKQVENSILSGNAINKTKNKTTIKIYQEIRKRISNLSSDEIDTLTKANLEEQKFLIFLSIIKTYQIIYDFVFEVFVPKFEAFDFYINDSDYNNFIESKISILPELQKVSNLTLKKIKQRIFTILFQVGMIDSIKNKKILKPLVSQNVVFVVREDNPIFLILCNY